MQSEYRKWKSPSMGREMELLIFGERGTPVIIFPTEQGRFNEWDDQGIFLALEEQIDMGYNQFFCVDSVAAESFLNTGADPHTRIMHNTRYLTYIMEEVHPFVAEINSNPYIITAGAGLGAYFSLLLALKHPDSFSKAVGLCGYYDISTHLNGFHDNTVYFNNPVEFIPNLNDEKLLRKINDTEIRLLTYSNDPNRGATKQMSDILWLKRIEHEHYVWEQETNNYWSVIAAMFKENLF